MDSTTPAILTALGQRPEMELLQQYRPTPLLRIADKPVIIYIVETLSKLGIRHFEIILHHYPNKIESVLGDGSRWGTHINYHLCKHPEALYKAYTPILFRFPNSNFLIGTGDSLPIFPPFFGTTSPLFLFDQNDKWLEWGICSSEMLKECIQNGQFNIPPNSKQNTDLLFSTQTPASLLSSNISILTNPDTVPQMPSNAHQAEKNLWISRGAIIHPTAKLVAPLFLGEGAQINPHVTIGPNSVIERRSLIDENSSVNNSLVCHDSYIGEGLNVQNSIIERNLLANIEHGTIISIKDNFILSELARPSPTRWFFRIAGRLFALLLLVLLSPLFLLLYLFTSIKKREYVFLPVKHPDQPLPLFEWPVFNIKKNNVIKRLLAELPSLIPLSLGNIHWVGTTALTKEQIESLPSYWKKLYFHSKVGIITQADLDHGTEASEDERYASDAYYAAHSSVVLDLKLILRCLIAPLQKLFQKRM